MHRYHDNGFLNFSHSEAQSPQVKDGIAFLQSQAGNGMMKASDMGHGYALYPCISLRQKALLCMAREGMANKQIAAALGISLASVKRLMHSLLRKLDARDRTHAVIKAIRLCIISIESNDDDDHIQR